MGTVLSIVGEVSSASAFEMFWQLYPRKQAKKDAEKAWKQARLTGDVVAAIMQALNWQIPQWDNPHYIPLPASYIRGERWTDEPLTGPKQESAFQRQHRQQVEALQQQNAGFDATQRIPREEWNR